MGRMIGIEIGSESLKLAEYNGRRIRKLAVEKMPQNMVREGRPTDINAMAAFIREVRRAYGIRKGDCALVLPPHSVVTSRLELPPMGAAEVMNALPFELQDYITGNTADWMFDFVVDRTKRDEDGKVTSMDVFAAAIPAALMEDYYTIFRKAGFKLKTAIPTEMAWVNLIRGKKLPRELCILDLGHKHTDLYIFADGSYVSGKVMDLGGEQLDEIVASIMKCDIHTARRHQDENTDYVLSSDAVIEALNRTAVDVMRTVSFYNYDGAGRNLHDIYLCGGGAFIAGMRNVILKSTGMQIHNMGAFFPNVSASRLLMGKCALAAGAAIQPQSERKAQMSNHALKAPKAPKATKERKPLITLTRSKPKKEEQEGGAIHGDE